MTAGPYAGFENETGFIFFLILAFSKVIAQKSFRIMRKICLFDYIKKY